MKAIAMAFAMVACAASRAAIVDGLEEIPAGDPLPISVDSECSACDGRARDAGRAIVQISPWRSRAAETRLWTMPDRSPTLTVGYAWRELQVERSSFTRLDRDRVTRRDSPLLDSNSTKFSYRPAPGWLFRISRDSLGSLDQFNPADETRRTSVSATYSRSLQGVDWQTTVAWGRNVHAGREPAVGYLVETMARTDGVDAVFGRLEQVRSDELLRSNDSAQRELFKLRKLTVGYYRDVRTAGPFAFDAGVFASRYFVPSFAAGSYGSEPTTYMLFLRFRLR